MSTSLIKVPAQGQKIIPGQPIPDNPVIPFIEGDGIGIDITPVAYLEEPTSFKPEPSTRKFAANYARPRSWF